MGRINHAERQVVDSRHNAVLQEVSDRPVEFGHHLPIVNPHLISMEGCTAEKLQAHEADQGGVRSLSRHQRGDLFELILVGLLHHHADLNASARGKQVLYAPESLFKTTPNACHAIMYLRRGRVQSDRHDGATCPGLCQLASVVGVVEHTAIRYDENLGVRKSFTAATQDRQQALFEERWLPTRERDVLSVRPQ